MSASTAESLGTVVERSSRLAQSALAQQSAASAALAQATGAVRTAQARLRDQLAEQARTEGRYLSQEYRDYAPSGYFIRKVLRPIFQRAPSLGEDCWIRGKVVGLKAHLSPKWGRKTCSGNRWASELCTFTPSRLFASQTR